MATPPVFLDAEILYASSMNKIGMWLVKTQIIGTGVSSVSVTSAFSSDYENYKIIVNGGVGSTTQAIGITMTGSTTGYYGSTIAASYNSATVSNNGMNNSSSWAFGGVSTATNNHATFELYGPNLAKTTAIAGAYINASTGGNGGTISGYHNVATAYTGFTLTVSGTMTGGTIRVYGYRDQDMTKPLIQIDDEVREMTDEEYAAYLLEVSEIPDIS